MRGPVDLFVPLNLLVDLLVGLFAPLRLVGVRFARRAAAEAAHDRESSNCGWTPATGVIGAGRRLLPAAAAAPSRLLLLVTLHQTLLLLPVHTAGRERDTNMTLVLSKRGETVGAYCTNWEGNVSPSSLTEPRNRPSVSH